jgi:hypothetical protein
MVFFYEFSSLSHYNSPISSLYAPQFLSENFKIESFVRRDFNLINRYGSGISYKYIGFFWYSINVEDEFINTISFGMNIFNIGSNVIYQYPNKASFGIGFNRTFLNFNICAYTLIKKFSYVCSYFEYKNVFFGFDIYLEEKFSTDYRFFISYKISDKSSIQISSSSNISGFSIGYKYNFFIFNYFYHSYLGDSFGFRIIYEK